VCGPVFDRGHNHAGGLRCNRTPDSLLSASDRAFRGRGTAAANGRKSDAFLRGTRRVVGLGRAYHRHHPTLVSGARLSVARRPPHFRTRQGGAVPGNPRTVRPGLAAAAIRHPGTPRVVGFDQSDLRLVQLGTRLSALETLAVGHGCIQRHRVFALLNGDLSHVRWTARGISATLYLVVCGSWIGYTAYIWLLEHVPTSKVSTYAYVNPVVAVFLGWLILHEHVDRFILAGSAIVVLSVILVTSAKVKEKVVTEELPTVEAAGD
jgi:uncharacterized membrane protein